MDWAVAGKGHESELTIFDDDLDGKTKKKISEFWWERLLSNEFREIYGAGGGGALSIRTLGLCDCAVKLITFDNDLEILNRIRDLCWKSVNFTDSSSLAFMQ